MIAVADAVAVAATLACQSAGRGRGCSPHRSPRVRPCSGTCRYRCSCAILLPWPAAHPPQPPTLSTSAVVYEDGRCQDQRCAADLPLRPYSGQSRDRGRSRSRGDSRGRSRNDGHSRRWPLHPLPCACSRVRSCSRSCPLLRLPREPRRPRAQISAAVVGSKCTPLLLPRLLLLRLLPPAPAPAAPYSPPCRRDPRKIGSCLRASSCTATGRMLSCARPAARSSSRRSLVR